MIIILSIINICRIESTNNQKGLMIMIVILGKLLKQEIIIWMGLLIGQGIILYNTNIIIYLSLEILSLTIYLLLNNNNQGRKYFVISCMGSILIIYGIYINYKLTGLPVWKINTHIILVICMKLGVYPFERWAINLYPNLSLDYLAYGLTLPKLLYLNLLLRDSILEN